MGKDWSDAVKKKLHDYGLLEVVFTKQKQLSWLAERNEKTIEDMKTELLDPKDLVFADKQAVSFEGKTEERYRCYFVYSKQKGRCYILGFNGQIRVITVFPLGRTTLRKYKKRFK